MKKTIRVSIPMDLEVDEGHLKEILGEEWQARFYAFEDERQFAQYAARLMLDRIETIPLAQFDGHTNQVIDVASLTIAPLDDPDWQTEYPELEG